MRIFNALLLAVVLLTQVSCFTPALWDASNPREYVAISADRVSEQDLKRKGISYHKDEKWNLIYCPKSSIRKLGDYTIRALATPVTVTVDAAGAAIVVVGTVGLVSLYGLGQQSEREGHPVTMYAH